MGDMFSKINSRAEEQERQAYADAAWAEEQARKAYARNRKAATRIFARRLACIFLAMCVFLVLKLCGLIAPVLNFVLCLLSALLAAIWFGAWLQFMFSNGGLLDVRIK